MEFFQTLGSVVSDRWKAKNYNEEFFPTIASQALAEMPPAHHVTLWDVVRWAMTAEQLPRQDDIEARFGNPPLTVYTGRKFRIEVLFWTQGIPGIHQHGFSGAFHVMHGSSIHSLWKFTSMKQIETRLLLGETHFERGEILSKGDSRPIVSGNAMFHATYHLGNPNLSVVIRTLTELDKQPQYMLMPPTIAYTTQDAISTVRRQTQLLRMLVAAGKHRELHEILRHLLATKDAYSVFEFITTIFSSIEDDEERDSLLSIARVNHPELIDALLPALVEREAGNRILSLLGAASGASSRFFLALLRNIPERATIMSLLSQRVPCADPARSAVEAVRSLAESGALPTQLEDSSLTVLEHLMADHSAEEIVSALAEKYGQECMPGDSDLRAVCSALRASWLFRSLQLNNPFDSNLSALTGTSALAAATPNPRAEFDRDTEPSAQGPQTLGKSTRSCGSGYRCALDTQPDSMVPPALVPTVASLREHAWFVNPHLRFSATGHCVDREILFPEGVTAPEPMVWVGDPVTSIVSPFVLGTTLAPMVATLQPGRELTATTSADVLRRMATAQIIYEPDANELRRRRWHASLQSSRSEFERGYVQLGALLHPFTLSATRAYFRDFIRQGGARYGDRQVHRRWAAHNEPVARFILHQLTPIVTAVSGVPVKPTYVYFASYYDEAQLARHTDREQCEYSISMLIDYSPEPDMESPWPLWLDTKEGPIAVRQCLGDALIYRGRQLPHYREKLPAGHTSTHLFMHYVSQDFCGSAD